MISGPIPSPGSVTMRWLIGALTPTAPSSATGPSRRSRSALVARRSPLPAASVSAMSSRPLSRRWRISWSISKRDLAPGEADLLLEQVDLARRRRRASARQSSLGEHDRQQADLGAVGVEDVGEARGDDRLEAVVLQAPGRVLARGAAAEVLARDEDRVGRQIPAGLLGPVVEQELAEARALDALEELLGHDLVGVDVGAVEVADGACDDAVESDAIAQLQSRMSTKWPSIAAAAAICGETRWVRPPRPWRPSKLRFEVEAQRSPGCRMSGFMPRHIEQPATRQSKPASRKTSVEALGLGLGLDLLGAGHDHRVDAVGDLAALRRPRRRRAGRRCASSCRSR